MSLLNRFLTINSNRTLKKPASTRGFVRGFRQSIFMLVSSHLLSFGTTFEGCANMEAYKSEFQQTDPCRKLECEIKIEWDGKGCAKEPSISITQIFIILISPTLTRNESFFLTRLASLSQRSQDTHLHERVWAVASLVSRIF